MSKLTRDQVSNVAHLARIAITDNEAEVHCKNLTKILDLVEQMNAASTDDIAPMAHPLDLTQPLRDDQVSEPNQRDAMQAIAPKTEAGLYLVPKVIETLEADVDA